MDHVDERPWNCRLENLCVILASENREKTRLAREARKRKRKAEAEEERQRQAADEAAAAAELKAALADAHAGKRGGAARAERAKTELRRVRAKAGKHGLGLPQGP